MKYLLRLALDNTQALEGNTALDTVAYACLIACAVAVLIIITGIGIGIVKRLWGCEKWL